MKYSTSNLFQIVMADDDDEDVEIVQDIFRALLFPVKLSNARDGQELLESLDNASPPHLILLDLNMPRINGMQVLQHLKTQQTLKNIPVVVFTTSNDPLHIKKAYDLGANCYIVKPVSYSDWKDKIRIIGEFWSCASLSY